jgi:hypothetical protein
VSYERRIGQFLDTQFDPTGASPGDGVDDSVVIRGMISR